MNLIAQYPEPIPGEIVVKVRSRNTLDVDPSHKQTGIRALDEALAPYRVQSMKRFCGILSTHQDPRGLARVLEISLDPDQDTDQLLSQLRTLPDVEYAEPKFRRFIKHNSGLYRGESFPLGGDELPNDPYFPLQWALPYINVPAAWDLITGDSTVVIANVDLGVDLDHPDLARILWRNSQENGGIPGVDDDGNGWIDDIYGWDFVDNDANPRPDEGDFHGTHTSGIAIASTNDGIGIAGIARDCRLMSVRVGTGLEIYQGYAGIYYAAHTGAKIISLSWGGYGYSQFERDVIEDAQALGCLIVAAAGNESTTNEHYPAAFDAVLAVAAIDQAGRKADFSNYGIWIDIAAPGVNIFSCMPHQQWDFLDGTSMATPVVAGVGALVASLHPDWNSQQLMSAVIASGDPIDGANPFFGNFLGAGCVNAFRAVDGGRGGLSLDSLRFDDSAGGDGDGIPEAGETIRLLVWLRSGSYGENQVVGELFETTFGLNLIASQSNFGSVQPNQVINNISNPFEFSLDLGVSRDQNLRMALELRDDNDRRLRRIPIQFVVNPSFGDHDIGNVTLTVTNFGAFGYLEYLVPEYAEPRGNGFKYPRDGLSWLYHGSWMVGTDEDHVSDNAYGDANFSRKDFQVEPDGELTISGPGVSDQDGIAIFRDGSATNPIGIRVVQQSYAWASPPDNDYVIATATVENQSAQTYSSLYIGLFLDWDVGPYLQNRAGWDNTNKVGWMTNQVFPSPCVGIARVDGDPASFRVVNNTQTIYVQGFPDNIKYQYLSGGIVIDHGQIDGDWSTVISAGPYIVGPGQIATVAYAIGAGDSQQDLINNMNAARTKYDQSVTNSIRKPSPEIAAWELMPIYPNPYNDVGRVQLIAHRQGDVSIYLYNILGQKTLTVFQGAVKEGIHTFDINSTCLPSGTYYCRLESLGFNTVRSVVILH